MTCPTLLSDQAARYKMKCLRFRVIEIDAYQDPSTKYVD